jgi:hypothetical protein
MLRKPQFFLAIFGLMLLLAASPCSYAQTVGGSGSLTTANTETPSDDTPASRARFLEYERQLNAMLKTRRNEEKEFIALVVNQIRLQKIPTKLVNTSFEWVRNKRPDTKYPFVYFERVLRLQATRLDLGKEIPSFDYAIYSQTTDPTDRRETTQLESPFSDNAASERTSGFFRADNLAPTSESNDVVGGIAERLSQQFSIGNLFRRFRR